MYNYVTTLYHLDNFLSWSHGLPFFIVKVLTRLATQYKKLDTQTKSHLRTVLEQAQANTKIVHEAKQQLLKGNDFSSYIVAVEKNAQSSLDSSQELHSKYDPVILGIKECCSKAKSGYERNEQKADVASKVHDNYICIFLVGWLVSFSVNW